MKKVLSDKLFFDASGGGVTVSGGEPLMQAAFVASLLRSCQQAGIHTAVETSGFAAWPVASQVFSHCDLVLLDMKHMDSALHQTYTGVPNEIILDNARRIYQAGVPMIIRVPVVPGFNDSVENISATAAFVAGSLGFDVAVHLLPYHRLGESKSESLEMDGWAIDTSPPTDDEMNRLQELVASYGLAVKIGG